MEDRVKLGGQDYVEGWVGRLNSGYGRVGLGWSVYDRRPYITHLAHNHHLPLSLSSP